MAVKDNVALNTGIPNTNSDLLNSVTYAFELISTERNETVVEADYSNCDTAAAELATQILNNRKFRDRALSNPQIEGFAGTGKAVSNWITPSIKEMIYRDKVRVIATSDQPDRTEYIFDQNVSD